MVLLCLIRMQLLTETYFELGFGLRYSNLDMFCAEIKVEQIQNKIKYKMIEMVELKYFNILPP